MPQFLHKVILISCRLQLKCHISDRPLIIIFHKLIFINFLIVVSNQELFLCTQSFPSLEFKLNQFSSVSSLSHVLLFVTPSETSQAQVGLPCWPPNLPWETFSACLLLACPSPCGPPWLQEPLWVLSPALMAGVRQSAVASCCVSLEHCSSLSEPSGLPGSPSPG